MKLFIKYPAILLLLLITLGSFDAFAQPVNLGGSNINFLQPKEYVIGPILVEGVDDFDPNAIKLISGLKEGSRVTVPGDEFSNGIKRLWAQKYFSDVQIYATKIVGNTIFLTIKLQGRKRLAGKFYDNVTKAKADKLEEVVTAQSGQLITETMIARTKRQIRGYYQEKGYYFTTVDIQVEDDTLANNAQTFRINVDKKKRVKIKDIVFKGVTSIKQYKLRKAMKDTKRQSIARIFSRSKYQVTAYKRDKNLMMEEFKAIGLRDAFIVKDTVYAINPKRLMIEIDINEGEKYYFGEHEWTGNTKYRSTFLDTVYGIKAGDVYNKSLMDQRLFQSPDSRDISSLYLDKGHLFFNLTPVEMKVVDHKISYEFRIKEGKPARVKNIIIKGNTKTNDHVILREIRTKPGDLFSRQDIIRTQRELAQLGFLDPEQFGVNPIPNPVDGTVDIEYSVVEKSSDQIELSGGWGGGRLIGTLGLSFNNFSLRNMFKKGAWAPLPSGDGQKLSIRAQTNGKFFQSYNFSFTEPWLGGKKPNNFSLWANYSNSSNGVSKTLDTYQGIGITGVGVGWGTRLKWPDDYFSSYLEGSYQYYDVRNYGSIFSFGNGYSNNISAKFVLSRNAIQGNPIYPSGGSKFTLTTKATLPYSLWDGITDYSEVTEQAKNKYTEYYKIKFTGEWYLPLTKDKKLMIVPRFGFGFLGAYNKNKGISPFERFYMGGSGLSGFQLDGREIIAMRGYDDQAISSGTGDPIITKFSVELRYPISLNPSATIYALVFAEAGNTFTSWKTFNPFRLKSSAGLGLRIFLPMFGLLGVDYGFGFNNLDTHSSGYGANNADILEKGWRGQFHFTIGMNLGEL
jgi:outer membrane protein insertion porin family